MDRTAIIEERLIKDIFDQKKRGTDSQIILVDLEKVEKVLNSLNSDSFRKDIYPGYVSNNEETELTSDKMSRRIVKESHLKKLISIFGEKNFPFSHNTFHKALSYLFTHNTYKNGKKVKEKLIKLISLSTGSNFSLGDFSISSYYKNSKFFGWITKEEIEENFMKILEELADLHEKFNLEKVGAIPPELTFSLLEYIDGDEWKYQELKEIAAQFEEIIKNLFCSIRRAHQYQLDLVLMEEEPW